MKIIGYTCTYNEEEYIPIVMPYVEAFGYDKFVVYDNGSTDRTVELLKQYPFVEVRPYDTGNNFDDDMRCKLHTLSFIECKKLSSEGELVWFTWTDFDEVFFVNSDSDFRGILEGDYHNRGYNCYYRNMVNLFPPKGMENANIKCLMGDKKFVHSIPGVMANIWVGGMKPTMLAVNDFQGVKFIGGNHYMLAKPAEGKEIKSYDDICRMYGFHLKFIDKNLLYRKWETYSKREGAGEITYKRLIDKFDSLYESQSSLAFPLSDYFLMDYFNSGLHNKTIEFNGIVKV